MLHDKNYKRLFASQPALLAHRLAAAEPAGDTAAEFVARHSKARPRGLLSVPADWAVCPFAVGAVWLHARGT